MFELKTKSGVKAQLIHWDRAGISGLYREFFNSCHSARMYANLLNGHNSSHFFVVEV